MELTCPAYQGMIDALTNRSKFAESAFLSTAKQLAEAPDPYPILEATIAELASTEELTRLAEENARLRAQVERAGDANALRIQLRQQETRSEDLIAQRVREREAEMAAQMDEKERNWTDKEQEYQRQIAENREVVKELKICQESASARLTEHDQKLGNKASQIPIVDGA
jgi:homeobox protein cut-like